ncbi:MAG: TraB/GumN family protein, partial [Kiritimatiellae bacterium]|nr:TraB/GumN family protein [Kiritimatiellia bacterium]
DEKMLDTLFLEEMKEEAPPMYEKLFVRRNQNWIPLLETYMQTPEIEFVLVGVGHMAGEEGVLNLLRKKGYTVRKL